MGNSITCPYCGSIKVDIINETRNALISKGVTSIIGSLTGLRGSSEVLNKTMFGTPTCKCLSCGREWLKGWNGGTDIEQRVTAIIVDKLGVDTAEVKPEASFTNDLGADSLDTVELIMEIEKSFGISIPDDVAEQIKTVGDAIRYIETHSN